MKLYDQFARECMALLNKQGIQALPIWEENNQKHKNNEYGEMWEDAGTKNMVLRSEMAYELGGGMCSAASGILFTSDREAVKQDEILLCGKDLPDIHTDQSYARLVLIRLQNELEEGQELYHTLRKIEYTKYHVNPKGYMMRMSTVNASEPVRIAKDALEDGLNYEKVGNLLLQGYHKNPQVAAVKQIFITQPDFPYGKLESLFAKASKITESLDYLFQNLRMDCGTCGLKPVCDEVEGMRELHFSSQERREY